MLCQEIGGEVETHDNQGNTQDLYDQHGSYRGFVQQQKVDIVKNTDHKIASQKLETYLDHQMGTVSGTVHDYGTNKEIFKNR